MTSQKKSIDRKKFNQTAMPITVSKRQGKAKKHKLKPVGKAGSKALRDEAVRELKEGKFKNGIIRSRPAKDKNGETWYRIYGKKTK